MPLHENPEFKKESFVSLLMAELVGLGTTMCAAMDAHPGFVPCRHAFDVLLEGLEAAAVPAHLEIIREQALLHLRDEVPHGIGVEMMAINRLSDSLTEIHATIYCERASHKGIIIGKQGAMLRTIGAEARRDIEGLLGTKVNLQLWVKVREDWRNRMDDLRTLGYES